MRNWLKNRIWGASDRLLERMAMRLFASADDKRDLSRSRRFVIMSVSGQGNLGDDAMLTALIDGLRARGENDITILIHHEADRHAYDGFEANVVSIEGYFDKWPSRRALQRMRSAFEAATNFVIIGADVLDGKYFAPRSWRRLFMAELGSRMGLRISIVGFSFSDLAAERIKGYLRRTANGYDIAARDPVSAKRVSAVLGRDVIAAADLAFLLKKPDAVSAPAAEAEAQVRRWREEGRTILVFNSNPIAVKSAHSAISLEDAAKGYAIMLDRLAMDERLAFLFLTHDNRWPNSDKEFMTEAAARTTRLGASNLFFLKETVRAADIKRLCSLADFTLTGRMHLGIASFGTGTPAMVLNYQGKVEGLLAMLGVSDLAYETTDILEPEVFAARVAANIEKREAFREIITANISNIRDRSWRNVDVILDHGSDAERADRGDRNAGSLGATLLSTIGI